MNWIPVQEIKDEALSNLEDEEAEKVIEDMQENGMLKVKENDEGERVAMIEGSFLGQLGDLVDDE